MYKIFVSYSFLPVNLSFNFVKMTFGNNYWLKYIGNIFITITFGMNTFFTSINMSAWNAIRFFQKLTFVILCVCTSYMIWYDVLGLYLSIHLWILNFPSKLSSNFMILFCWNTTELCILYKFILTVSYFCVSCNISFANQLH